MRRRSVVGIVLVLLVVMFVGSGSVTAAAECPQPYQPWFQGSTYSGNGTVPDLGQSILFTSRPPDTDGDGVADTIVVDEDDEGGPFQSVEIQRGDGTVTLLPGKSHKYIYPTSYGPQPGDLDGDGRDELILGVDQNGEQFLLPGTTAPGTYDIDIAGISMKGYASVSQPVGDQDGDGGGDLAFPTGSEEWSVFSGADLLTPGPGGVLHELGPIRSYPATGLGAAVLTPGAAPTVIAGRQAGDGVALTVHREQPDELVAAGPIINYTGGFGTIGVFSHNGQTLVTVTADDRSGTTLVVWNLSDPCARFVAANRPRPSPRPPAAEPVPGTVALTG